MSLVSEQLGEFNKVIDHFKKDLATLKTGRANPAILDGVLVENYGLKMPLSQLASVSVTEARCLLIQPWDKNLLKEMEKAIREANLDLGLANEGERLRVTVPPMTEESRKNIVKLLHQKMEQAKIAVRTTRDDIKEKILTAEKNKEFGEDEKYSLIEELDQKTGEYNGQIKELGDAKEEEIMTI